MLRATFAMRASKSGISRLSPTWVGSTVGATLECGDHHRRQVLTARRVVAKRACLSV
jgi:hypothetical protein